MVVINRNWIGVKRRKRTEWEMCTTGLDQIAIHYL